MNEDHDQIRVFERQHERDNLARLARKIGDGSSDGLDLFTSHTIAEGRDSQTSNLVASLVAAVLVGAICFYLQ